MARKTSKFMIGLFVTVGVLIGLAAIIWLGASDYLKRDRSMSPISTNRSRAFKLTRR
jgi:hypothetical protein